MSGSNSNQHSTLPGLCFSTKPEPRRTWRGPTDAHPEECGASPRSRMDIGKPQPSSPACEWGKSARRWCLTDPWTAKHSLPTYAHFYARRLRLATLSRPDEKSRFRRLKIPHPGCGGGFVDHHRVAKHGASRGSGGGQCWRATRQGIPGRKLIETMSAGSGGRDRSRLLFRCPTPIGSIDLPMPEKTHLPLPPLLRPGLAASAASTVGRSPD